MPQPFDTCSDLENLDVNERLNYVLGQVLGVKEFKQEQAHFLNKGRSHNRYLHGYGTVSGLEVSVEGTGEDLKIKVSPGLAIDQLGREIKVDKVQCASIKEINSWLAAESAESTEEPKKKNWETLLEATSDATKRNIYVTLCYKACETEKQPILGDSCRGDSGEGGVIQPTRIRDDFELQLRAKAPNQEEEEYVQKMASFLAKVEFSPNESSISLELIAPEPEEETPQQPSAPVTVPEEAQAQGESTTPAAAESVGDTVTSDSTVSPEKISSLVELWDWLDDAIEFARIKSIKFSEEHGRKLLQDFMRYWVTQKRSEFEALKDDCILLNVVSCKLTDNGEIDKEDSDVLKVDNLQRPYLLHTRLLQELLLSLYRRQSAPSSAISLPEITAKAEPTDDENPTVTIDKGEPNKLVFEFKIPRGKPATSVPPLNSTDYQVFHPKDFFVEDREGSPQTIFLIENRDAKDPLSGDAAVEKGYNLSLANISSAKYKFFKHYPALYFGTTQEPTTQEHKIAIFSTVWNDTQRTPVLYFYSTTDNPGLSDAPIPWQIAWYWEIDGVPLREGFSTYQFDIPGMSSDQITVSRPLPLLRPKGFEQSKYLVVYMMLGKSEQERSESFKLILDPRINVYLLMANLV